MKNIKMITVLTAGIIIGSMTVTAAIAAPAKLQSTKMTQTTRIGAARAKEIALNHAGVQVADATFKKAELENEQGVAVYDVEFYTNSAKYEYEIHAVNGTVREFDKENRKTVSTTPNTNNQTSAGQNGNDQAAVNGSTSSQPVEKPSTNDQITTTPNTNNQQSTNQNTNNEVVTKPNTNNQGSTSQEATSQSAAITVAKAKEIALAHAGLTGQSVVYEKAKLDKDDGVATYEIEFRHNGMEYDYEINAASGIIMEFDVDND